MSNDTGGHRSVMHNTSWRDGILCQGIATDMEGGSMGQTTGDFARSVVTAYERMNGFEATQEIAGGGLRIRARVRCAGAARLVVEYQAVENPIDELTERLVGDADYSTAERIGMVFSYDGRVSWSHDPSTETVVERRGRRLGEPIGDIDMLGDIGFLRDLTSEYLLRDDGDAEIEGRAVRRLSMKPKRPFHASSFRICSHPIRVARISFDVETYFPLEMEIEPTSASPLYAVLGEREPLRISYRNVKPIDGLIVEEPTAKRTFRESAPAADDLPEAAPFDVSLTPFRVAGFEPIPGSISLVVDDGGGRGFLEATLAETQPPEARKRLVIRCGNYVSRNMARRKVLLAEEGEEVDIGDVTAHFLDRAAALAQEIPGLVDQNLGEIGWERNGVYWFVLGEGVARDVLIDLAKNEPGDA